MIALLAAILLIPALLIYCFKNAYNKPPNFPPGTLYSATHPHTGRRSFAGRLAGGGRSPVYPSQPNFKKCPPNLPIYGGYWIILLQKLNDLATAFRILGEKYKTKVVGVLLATYPAICVNDPALIKEVLNREEFDGRMDIILFRLRSFWKKLGIFFTDQYFWQEQRRFSLRYLRDYGFGRRDYTLEDVTSDEIKEMLDMGINGPKYPAEEEFVKGDLVNIPYFFAIPFINGVLQVLSRSTVPRPEYKKLWSLSRGTFMFQRSSNDLGAALSLTPWLKDVLPNYSGYNGLVEGNSYLLNFFQTLVDEAIKTHDASYDRHFLDMYIRKMKEEQSTKERTTYSVDQLTLTCTDFMFPAASAVQSVLAILVERILLQPEIQDKIHEEIDRVVGRDRLPNLDDRRNMPYTEACIREIMRFETTVPLGIPHRAMVDTKLGGYDIPENTMISVNLTMLHMDESIWGDPQNFRPERFIKNGQLDVASDKSLPFGAGKRLCAGETYARQSMFQVFAAFMQAFKLSTVDGKPLRKPSKRLQGLITTIPEFWIRVTPRK